MNVTDKDSLSQESSNREPHQKATMFPPSLTSKPPAQSVMDQTSQAASPASSYYQNVAQKGKLILPTAVWIIIVVAGLCFLGLLGSLNHTLKTLDTLVEIEQAKHNKQVEQEAKFAGQNKLESLAPTIPKAGELKLENPDETDDTDHQELSSADSRTKLESWLSLPPWTSLDPAEAYPARPSISSISSLIDSFLQSASSNPDGLKPVGGSIIIASGGLSPNNERPPSYGQQGDDASMVDSMLQQIMGDLVGDDDDGAAKSAKSNNQGPLIAANIDKINININTQPSDQGSSVRGDEWAIKSAVNRRDEEMKALDNSIDSLMSKLMEPIKSSQNAHPDLGPAGMFLPLPAPVIHTAGAPFQHHRFEHSRAPLMSPFSSLAEIMMPIESLNGSPGGTSDDKESSTQPMFGRPRPTPLIITLNADEPTMFGNEPKVRAPSDGLGFTRRPSAIGSPYELMTSNSDLAQKPLNKSPSDMSDHDLINSLAQSLFQATQENQRQASDDNDDDDDSENAAPGSEVLFFNGEPLIGDKKQSISMNDQDQLKDRNQVSDLFNLFFGSPPSSKLVVATKVVEPTIEPFKKSPPPPMAPTTTVPSLQETTLLRQNESGPSDGATTAQPGRIGDQEQRPLSTRSPLSSSLDPGRDVEQFVNTFLDNMLALPQFASDQNNSPVKVDSSSASAANKDSHESTSTESPSSPPDPPATSSSSSPFKSFDTKDEQPPKDKLPATVVPQPTPPSVSLPPIAGRTPPQTTTATTSEQQPVSQSSIERSPEIVASDATVTTASLPSTERPKQQSMATDATIGTSNTTITDEGSSQTVGTSATTPMSEDKATTSMPENATTPFKAFLQKADNFIERNLFKFKRLLN